MGNGNTSPRGRDIPAKALKPDPEQEKINQNKARQAKMDALRDSKLTATNLRKPKVPYKPKKYDSDGRTISDVESIRSEDFRSPKTAEFTPVESKPVSRFQAPAKQVSNTESSDMSENVLFYLNKIESHPDGATIETIMEEWFRDYKLLERHHGYIQWLFPNFFRSRFNSQAAPLTQRDAAHFRTNIEIANRLVRSYEFIYDFFGLKLEDKQTGKVVRAKNFLERIQATLVDSPHNLLRMQRILTHMNNVGFRRYAHQLVDFLMAEMKGDSRNVEGYPLSFLKKDWVTTFAKYGSKATKSDRNQFCFTSDEKDYEDGIYFKTR